MDAGPWSVYSRKGNDKSSLTYVASSFKLMMIPVVLYLNHFLLVKYGILAKGTANPFKPLLLPMGRLANGKYTRQWWDFLFCANYIVFWSLYVSISCGI